MGSRDGLVTWKRFKLRRCRAHAGTSCTPIGINRILSRRLQFMDDVIKMEFANTVVFAKPTIFFHSANMPNSVELVDNLPSPRFIKTHLPWQLLPKGLSTVKPKVRFVFPQSFVAFQKD